jgi:hypothetical protein
VDRNGLGLTQFEVLQEIAAIERLLNFLPDIPAVYPAWKEIVRDHQVEGVKMYYARLVAIMSVYAVESILTLNDADFRRHVKISAIRPS